MNKKNLANAQLLTGISTSDTTITVKSGQGASLPDAPFLATLSPLGVLSTIDNSEIILVTAVSSDTLTVSRAQEGTSAKEFSADSILANSIYVRDTIPVGGTNGQIIKRTSTGYVWANESNTTYSEISESEIEDGTSSNARTISGRRVGFLKRLIIGLNNPIGTLYFNADDPTDPGVLLGVGVWEPYAEGRVPVGKASSGTFDTAGATMGSESHTHTLNNAAAQIGAKLGAADTLGYRNRDVGTMNGSIYTLQAPNVSNGTNGARSHNTALTGSTDSTSHIQPSIVVYIWRRVS